MTGHCKTAVTINPAVSMRCAPGRLFIEAAQPIGYDTLIFLFFMPDGTFGPIHHFVSTDDAIIAPVQEIFEK